MWGADIAVVCYLSAGVCLEVSSPRSPPDAAGCAAGAGHNGRFHCHLRPCRRCDCCRRTMADYCIPLCRIADWRGDGGIGGLVAHRAQNPWDCLCRPCAHHAGPQPGQHARLWRCLCHWIPQLHVACVPGGGRQCLNRRQRGSIIWAVHRLCTGDGDSRSGRYVGHGALPAHDLPVA